MALVTSEFGGPPLWLTQYPVERVGRFFAGENGDENAAAPNRVDEAGGIPCQHPTVTGKPFASKREIPGGIHFGDAPCPRHLVDNFGVFLKNLGVGRLRL